MDIWTCTLLEVKVATWCACMLESLCTVCKVWETYLGNDHIKVNWSHIEVSHFKRAPNGSSVRLSDVALQGRIDGPRAPPTASSAIHKRIIGKDAHTCCINVEISGKPSCNIQCMIVHVPMNSS